MSIGVCRRNVLISICLVSIFIISSIAEASAYSPGFEWRKKDDYTAGTVNGSTVGNPNLDQLGNPAWSYEHFIGPSENWDSSSLMPWYNDWRWGVAYGFVNVSKWDQNTHLDTNWNNTGLNSLVRWINPTGGSIEVDLTGHLRTVWGGQNWDSTKKDWTDYFVASPSDVRVVLGYHDFSAGTSTLLIDNTYDSPITTDTVCNTWGECPYIDTSLDRTLSIDAGDSLFWTTITLGSTPGKNRWITSTDGTVAITMVPEPGSYALFMAGMFVLGVRRFRIKTLYRKNV